ncbi:MAG TPA: MBL fold metallo-hydrolase [bacterium]|nr:MBL fold metallo-hydrolase [bacterium]
MIVETLEVGPFMENTFVVGCEETKEAVVIDPGAEPERILAAIDKRGLNVSRIINTHAHIDHIGAVQAIRVAKGAKFLLHETEAPFVEGYERQCQFFGVRFGDKPEIDGFLKEGDIIEVGNLKATVIFTPGHSPGGLCFNFGERVFAGDTLFNGSIGRTDLPGGSQQLLLDNIKNKLLTLPPQTVVYCGHGPATTIGHEKAHNPFLTGGFSFF